MDIGIKIREERKKRRIQQQVLAEKSGISQTTLSQIENGKQVPTIDTLKKISKILKIQYPALLFLSLDENSIHESKREEYKLIAPAINAIIEKFFVEE
jgi:transcriptional regulator with XRE-family HTH domain